MQRMALSLSLVVLQFPLLGCRSEKPVTPQQLSNAFLDFKIKCVDSTQRDIRWIVERFFRALTSGSIVVALTEFEAIRQESIEAERRCFWKIPSEFPDDARSAFLVASVYYEKTIEHLKLAAEDEIDVLDNGNLSKLLSVRKNLELAAFYVRKAEAEIARGTEIVQNKIRELSMNQQKPH